MMSCDSREWMTPFSKGSGWMHLVNMLIPEEQVILSAQILSTRDWGGTYKLCQAADMLGFTI